MAERHIPIVSDDEVMGGEPRIEGRRITVRQIATFVEEGGQAAETVADRYDLDVGDVYRNWRPPTIIPARWRGSNAIENVTSAPPSKMAQSAGRRCANRDRNVSVFQHNTVYTCRR